MRNKKNAIENYFNELKPQTDPLIDQSRNAALGLGLQQISMGDAELEIIKTLLRIHGSKKFIEVGTLTGASGVAILEALGPQGQFWTLEKQAVHAELALPILQQAADRQKQSVQLLIGDARETLGELAAHSPFDGIFIDGNKAAYGDYLVWAEVHIRKGGLILADNIFLGGTVWGGESQKFSKKQILVMQKFNQRLSDPNLYQSAIIPTSEGLMAAIKLF